MVTSLWPRFLSTLHIRDEYVILPRAGELIELWRALALNLGRRHYCGTGAAEHCTSGLDVSVSHFLPNFNNVVDSSSVQ